MATVVHDIAMFLKMYRDNHNKNDRENMVRVALLAHTGVQLRHALRSSDKFVMMCPLTNRPIEIGFQSSFTLDEIEEALKKAGINPHKK